MSKLVKISWEKLEYYNLAWSARDAGFDIAFYDDYKPAVQKLVKSQTVNIAIDYLADEYEELTGKSLLDVKNGVYVIRLASNFSVRYSQGVSPIVYIGRGAVNGRIKTHFSKKLFPLMESLTGATFDFWIANPKRGGQGKTAENYHKQLEHDLLEGFREKFGDDLNKYPLLNKVRGEDCGMELGGNWDQPLRGDNRRHMWTLEPTKHFKIS